MTSSKIRGFQTSSPFHHLPSLLPGPPLDDAIFHQPPPLFPNMILGKIFHGKIEKLRNQDLAMNIIQNKNQKLVESYILRYLSSVLSYCSDKLHKHVQTNTMSCSQVHLLDLH